MFLQSSDVEGGIEALMERMRKLTEEAQEEMTQEELQKRFERVENQSAECKKTNISNVVILPGYLFSYLYVILHGHLFSYLYVILVIFVFIFACHFT